MKTVRILFFALIMLAITPMIAQTADEIIDNYIENTGGADAWNALTGTKMSGSATNAGMTIPVDIINMKDGKTMITIDLQGQKMTQLAFDGETMWTFNFITMQPEKDDTETTENMKANLGNFPTPFLNYKEKGYSVELLGKETKDGIETFKIQLTQNPVMINGVEEPSITYYYFDTETFIPIMSESPINAGPMKGQMSTQTFSEYQEVGGLYFPFLMTMTGQTITLKEIVLNPEIDMSLFSFPGE
jgi:outer membrane lipoprotein-sorting protein